MLQMHVLDRARPVDVVGRRLVHRLTPSQLAAIGGAADIVLAALDEPVAPSR